MRFLNPAAWWWVTVIPALIGAWWIHARARDRFADRFGVRRQGRGREAALLVSVVAAAVALTAALARPQWQREVEEPQFATIDLVVVIDRSASMFAEDVAPTRFARAVSELRRLLSTERDRFGRVALIEFSSSAVVLSTFTRDLGAVGFYLDWIQEDPSMRFGTDLATALSQARDLIARDRQATRKAVVIVSDGASQDTDLAASLESLTAMHVPVFTAAIGIDRRAPIVMRTAAGAASAVVDDTGRPLAADTDHTILEQIARTTGGRFVPAPAGVGLADRLAEALGRTPPMTGTRTSIEYRDAYRECLFLAAICAVVAGLML